MDLAVQVLEPNYHFHVCPVHVRLSNVKTTSSLHAVQSVMSERQCMYVVVQDPSLVIRASHECLGLFLRADIEGLVVDALEAAFDHCVFLLLCLNNTLVQIGVLHTHSLTIDHDVATNSLCCVVYHMLLINQPNSTSSASIPRTP